MPSGDAKHRADDDTTAFFAIHRPLVGAGSCLTPEELSWIEEGMRDTIDNGLASQPTQCDE